MCSAVRRRMSENGIVCVIPQAGPGTSWRDVLLDGDTSLIGRRHQSLSMSVPVPSPPPQHMPTRANFAASVRSSSCRALVTRDGSCCSEGMAERNGSAVGS